MANLRDFLLGIASSGALAITSAIAACPTYPLGLSQSVVGGQSQFIYVASNSFSLDIDESVEDAKETATVAAKAGLARSLYTTKLSGVQVLFVCTSGDKVFAGVSATHQSVLAAKSFGKQLEKSLQSTSTPKPLTTYTDR